MLCFQPLTPSPKRLYSSAQRRKDFQTTVTTASTLLLPSPTPPHLLSAPTCHHTHTNTIQHTNTHTKPPRAASFSLFRSEQLLVPGIPLSSIYGTSHHPLTDCTTPIFTQIRNLFSFYFM
mmetsp:Transcript_10657/g.18924  ORF Transcript_10657/g.18924 Transcript_10657/m.18924 type:complete len:120 (+) Transcript_10657:1811-2170(+)